MNRIVSLVNDSFNNLTTIPKYFLATAAIANLPYIRDLLILPKIVALAWSPWTILTNMLVGRVLLLPASVVFILFSLKYFENVWGKPELIKYLLVTALVSQILLIVLIIVCSFFVGGQLL
jgi:membrane associated rhomboid family serine protease